MVAIINAKIIHQNNIIEGKVLLFNTLIIGIVDTPPNGYEIVDARGDYLSAGFIDIHIHGSSGADVMDSSKGALESISQSILSTGTTSFVATTMSMSQEEITKALDNLLKYSRSVTGAKIEGIHLEGPFINPNRAGAQDRKYIQKADHRWLEPYLRYISIITLAPEIEGGKEFIEYIREFYPHIVLSIGHSDASYQEAIGSFEWGISHSTHLFNAMSPLHHRDGGVVGAVLDSDITADIIADLIHLDPMIFRLLDNIKRGEIVLITDAMRAGCMCEGEYTLGGQKVLVKDGKATLSNGVIAGSTLKLNEAIRNYHHHTNCSLPQAISMVTTLPAKILNRDIGELKEGRVANIVLFDSDINIKSVYIDGIVPTANKE